MPTSNISLLQTSGAPRGSEFMNPILQKLLHRISSNDPTLTQLLLSRLPLFQISLEEVTTIVKALQQNSHITSLELWLPDVIPTPETSGRDTLHDSEMVDIDAVDYFFLAKELSASTSVTALSINYASTNDAWCQLFRGLKGNRSIQTLTLGEATTFNTIDDKLVWDEATCEHFRHFLHGNCTLQSLTLKGIQLSAIGMREVAAGLIENGTLQSLEIHQLSTSEIDSSPLGHLLLDLRSSRIRRLSVVECDLSFEYVDEDENHPLTALLAHNQNLQHLGLMASLDVDGVRPLSFGMLDNDQLRCLDLRGNDLSYVSWEAMGEFLGRSALNLQELLLEETSMDDKSLASLTPGLRRNTSLRKIDLRGNRLSGECMFCLEHAIRSHPKLEALDVSENNIGDIGATFGSQLLRNNSHLKHLHLDSCHISPIGVLSICEGLAHNQSLTLMSLCQNELKEAGAQAVAEMLLWNTQLQTLELAACALSDSGVQHIARALHRNDSLQCLGLAFNDFGSKGAQYLGEMLPFSRLRSLDLQFNDIESEGMEYLVQGVQRNYHLEDLRLLRSVNAGKPERQTTQLAPIAHYLALNRAGRRIVTDGPAPSLWPFILTRAREKYGTNALFHMLQAIPEHAFRSSAQ